MTFKHFKRLSTTEQFQDNMDVNANFLVSIVDEGDTETLLLTDNIYDFWKIYMNINFS